jgi:hypothetical protein
MAYSRVPFTYTSGPQVFPTNFALGVLEIDHIKVYVDGVVDGLGNPIEYAFTYNVATGNVTVTDALTPGQTGVIVRQVPIDALIADFEAGADVSKRNLVRAVKQTLMSVQEAADGREADSQLIQDTVAEVNAIADGIADNVAQTTADRIAAQAAATAAGVSEANAEADRASTAADRVQTGLDRSATAADRVQTGLDRVATAADRVITTADRVQTQADRAVTTADRTQTGLDRVQTGSDKTAAETARTQAQTARDTAAGILTAVEAQATAFSALNPENRIINGAFDFWQRGTSFTTQAYGADRWLNNLNGGTVTMSRQSFAIDDTLGSNSPTFFLRQAVSGQSLASHYAATTHRIEGVRSYAGQTITVLGWARRSSGAGNIAVEAAQVFGTGGSPSPTVVGVGQPVTLTGSWAPFAVTIAVPSIAGRTLGTDGNDSINLLIWTSAGSDFNSRANSLGLQTIGVDLWGIHVKLGVHTTAAVEMYRQPELGPELARCERYYETGTIRLAGTSALGIANVTPVSYKTTKRAIPAVSLIDRVAVGNVSALNYSAGGINAAGFAFTTGDGTGAGGYIAQCNYIADAEL